MGLTAYLASAAALHPGRIAVRERQRAVTYQQLDHMSNALAVTLEQNGVTRGTRVGIWLNKSVEAITGIHGILRAGAAYVPLDPTAPVRRVAVVLANCRPACLITTADRARALAQAANGRIDVALLVLADGTQLEDSPEVHAIGWSDALSRGQDAPPVRVESAPDDLAYVLYTSGSTGVPKGVMLTHRNAQAFVDWAAGEFELGPEDVLASHAPLHFDLSVFDVFGAASAGGCLTLVPDSLQGIGSGLVRFVAEEGISVWYSVPSALRRMAAADNSALLAGSRLRVVAFAGEEYRVRYLKALCSAVPRDAALYNLYGPTETNVCTYHRIGPGDVSEGGPPVPPIGQPCPYAAALLMDGCTVLPDAADGMIGELCIAGDSVMAGYWGDAEATALRMVKPRGHEVQYYRTGDIVRRDPEGRYFFIGRSDHMVKVKGYRIELGEVEGAINQHPEVDEVVCVTVQDRIAETTLVAFAVMAAGSDVDAAALRRHCRQFLPHYMIPERFVLVPELTYTSTGKVDRPALSAIATAEHRGQADPRDGRKPDRG